MKRLLFCLVLASLLFALPAEAAKFIFNDNQEGVIVNFLFEPFGYLDGTIRVADGVSARDQIDENGVNFALTNWIRQNGPFTSPGDADECAMHWWIWKNDGVEVSKPQRPIEHDAWTVTLTGFVDSINSAFLLLSEVQRDIDSSRSLYDEGTVIATTQPGGRFLQAQQRAYSKARRILRDAP